jgi:hypothetical protein
MSYSFYPACGAPIDISNPEITGDALHVFAISKRYNHFGIIRRNEDGEEFHVSSEQGVKRFQNEIRKEIMSNKTQKE